MDGAGVAGTTWTAWRVSAAAAGLAAGARDAGALADYEAALTQTVARRSARCRCRVERAEAAAGRSAVAVAVVEERETGESAAAAQVLVVAPRAKGGATVALARGRPALTAAVLDWVRASFGAYVAALVVPEAALVAAANRWAGLAARTDGLKERAVELTFETDRAGGNLRTTTLAMPAEALEALDKADDAVEAARAYFFERFRIRLDSAFALVRVATPVAMLGATGRFKCLEARHLDAALAELDAVQAHG